LQVIQKQFLSFLTGMIGHFLGDYL